MMGLSRNAGTALSGVEHLAQSIGDILSTPIGSRVMRREYGSMLPELVDQPITSATRLLMAAATATALRRWEPRIALKRATIAADPDAPGQVTIRIEGERTDTPNPIDRFALSIPLRGGGPAPAFAT